MALRRFLRNRSAPTNITRFHGRVENLERRDLFAGDFIPQSPILESEIDVDSVPFASQTLDDQTRQGRRGVNRDPRSPAANPPRQAPRLAIDDVAISSEDFASIDGEGHNLSRETWGSVGQVLENWTTVSYEDGVSSPTGQNRISAREVSNIVIATPGDTVNAQGLSDLTWLFGQFIDHDIDLSESGDEAFDIEVPAGDIWFDPNGTGQATISFHRTDYVESENGVRQQFNEITSFLDGSVIYGSDQERADALRTFTDGRLATTEGNLLPFNEAGLDNAGGTDATLFLAGDVRANENAALTAMHTLWVREHNRVATQISAANPSLEDEEIYQLARRYVTGELQAITYNEFLPALLGNNAVSTYSGYDETVNPNIANIFSTAAYRFGHSMLSPELLRLNNNGTVANEGNLALQDAFFNPNALTQNGIDSILLGASVQTAQEVDPYLIDDVRNFLFGPPGSGGFDLASLNIQRGRDHGLADFNQVRVDMGLPPVASVADISSDPEVQRRLAEAYSDVDSIDAWVGMLAEDHVAGSTLGVTATTIIAEQFTRLRDGDRLFYENVFEGPQLQQLRNTSLADVIERNTSIEFDRGANVFFAGAAGITSDEVEPEPLGPMGTPPADLPPPVRPQDPERPFDRDGAHEVSPQRADAPPALGEPLGIPPNAFNDPVEQNDAERESRLRRPDQNVPPNSPPIPNALATDLAFADLARDGRQ